MIPLTALSQEVTDTALATIYSVNCEPIADHTFVDSGYALVVADVQINCVRSKIITFTASLKDLGELCAMRNSNIPYVRKTVIVSNFDPVNGGVLSGLREVQNSQCGR